LPLVRLSGDKTSTPDEPLRRFLYRDTETLELLEVEATTREILDQESHGFLTLPGGREVRRSVGEELRRDGVEPRRKSRVNSRAKWPMVSVNAGVSPSQISELRQHWQERGITGCDVMPNGDVVWESRQARRIDCKSRGIYDRDGGYGDPMPDNC
jgi:hypothetical protein